MSKRKNKKKEEEGMDESWLLPYADILTLLLALFIVLYSMSTVDAKKFQELSQVFNSVFVGEKGIIDNGGTLPTDMPQHERKDDDKSNESTFKSEQKREGEELEKIQERVEQYITDNVLSERFETSLTKQGLLITIRDNVLFDPGSAYVRKENRKTAEELSKLLTMEPPREIVISGHTDNVPMHSTTYSSNWELSVSRAVNFMKLILENEALDPRLFSAKGSGEYQPIASNESKEGRAQNRRVEILILPLIDISSETAE